MSDRRGEQSWELGLIGGSEKRKIEIVPYDPAWPERFQVHAGRLKRALGNMALRIEHIGSTSVPGLAAKPIIDVLVVVPNSAEESSYLPQIVGAGYELRVREPDFEEHRMFRTPKRDAHIHILSRSSPEIDRYLLFRDHLRRDPAACRRYQELKLQLSTRDWDDMNEYAAAKTSFIENAIAAGSVAAGEGS